MWEYCRLQEKLILYSVKKHAFNLCIYSKFKAHTPISFKNFEFKNLCWFIVSLFQWNLIKCQIKHWYFSPLPFMSSIFKKNWNIHRLQLRHVQIISLCPTMKSNMPLYDTEVTHWIRHNFSKFIDNWENFHGIDYLWISKNSI